MSHENEIPKIIHYCWFGGNPLPELAQKCIASWKKFLPDYEIKEWNESNYDVNKILYTKQAYEAKKYAFVSDYARFDILYEYGGIYLDTDVEVIRSIPKLIIENPFLGFETPGRVATGLGIAAYKDMTLIGEILNSYKSDKFKNDDETLNYYTVVDRVTDILKKYGLRNENVIQNIRDFIIYPVDYFCPKDCVTGELNLTNNSCTIHHYDGSWVEAWEKKAKLFYTKLQTNFGNGILTKLIFIPYYFIIRIKNIGFSQTIKEIKYGR